MTEMTRDRDEAPACPACPGGLLHPRKGVFGLQCETCGVIVPNPSDTPRMVACTCAQRVGHSYFCDIGKEDRRLMAHRVAVADGHGANTPTSKDTNPKDAVAVAHLKFSALPARVLAGVALALTEGAYKYGRHNYRVAGVKASVYYDAAIDHLLAWYEGEDIDPASGFHHIDKAIAGLMVLRDAQLGGMCSDDRPPSVVPGWIERGHEETAKLFERMRSKHGEPKAPFVREEPSRVIIGVDPGVPGSECTAVAIMQGGRVLATQVIDPPARPADKIEIEPLRTGVPGTVEPAEEPRPAGVPEGARWGYVTIGGERRVMHDKPVESNGDPWPCPAVYVEGLRWPVDEDDNPRHVNLRTVPEHERVQFLATVRAFGAGLDRDQAPLASTP